MRAWHRTGVATTLALLLLATPGARAEDLVITETGSTLMRPLFGLWAAGYASHHPGVRITTAGTGSEAGMQQALSGQVMIGASIGMPGRIASVKGSRTTQAVRRIRNSSISRWRSRRRVSAVNLPGPGRPLRLDGPTLAGIYDGSIRQWDAPGIAALNPGVTLPHHAIVPVRRRDGSGDSFIFTQFLSFSTPSWDARPASAPARPGRRSPAPWRRSSATTAWCRRMHAHSHTRSAMSASDSDLGTLAHAFALKKRRRRFRREPTARDESLAPQCPRRSGPTVVAKSLRRCTRGRHDQPGDAVRRASRGRPHAYPDW